MSSVYPSIQGCPFRKIVSWKYGGHGLTLETLSCGHTHTAYKTDAGATKRRCYTCKREKERKA